jgi:HK97 family phage prohead protease
MKNLTGPVNVKWMGDDDQGKFQAYASVFNNIDSYGDMVIPGAFSKTLADDFGPDGSGVPLYWRHRMDDPFMNLGATTSAKEDDHGLWIEGQLDLETPAAAQTYKLLKQGRASQMSFAYDIDEGAWVDRKPEDGGSYYELRQLKLHEVSVVPVGANQETEVLAVKSAVDAVAREVRLGRDISHEEWDELMATAKSFIDLLSKVQQPGAGESDAKTEEPEGAKAEEPTTVHGYGELAELTLKMLAG